MVDSLSVSFRLQRVTIETAHVSVLLTTELMQPNVNEPGTEAIKHGETHASRDRARASAINGLEVGRRDDDNATSDPNTTRFLRVIWKPR